MYSYSIQGYKRQYRAYFKCIVIKSQRTAHRIANFLYLIKHRFFTHYLKTGTWKTFLSSFSFLYARRIIGISVDGCFASIRLGSHTAALAAHILLPLKPSGGLLYSFWSVVFIADNVSPAWDASPQPNQNPLPQRCLQLPMLSVMYSFWESYESRSQRKA